VFSTKFTVETACKDQKRHFKQTWNNNMGKANDAKIKDQTGDDFTSITFNPDLAKFSMDSLNEDTVALLSRRAYDVAASAKGVKVYLNGKKIPIKSFKDYVDFFIKGHEDATGQQVKAVYEQASDRWEVSVAVSDNGFQQMSFVNSIATTKGGRHVDHVSKLIENNIAEAVKKKNKGGITIKPHQIRNHMWIFINCLIVNPSFDSQTKENMTLAQNKFGSKCTLSPKFFTQLGKSGIVESVLAWSKFKQDLDMKKAHTSKKTSKLRGVSKLEDANDAGTKNSIDCTLILTEGDSAKTLAVAGLSVIGRDKYGVYPLRGKLLNVRDASHKQIMENKEINEMVKIIGLTYKKKYQTVDDLKSLRYGKLMIMTDQDQDGSHIKGLLINFIHHNWPSLLKLPFLEEFITPIVKISKGGQSQSFYSLPEFNEWKEATENWHTWKIKYYKGLGTSTSKEAKEYFSDMRRHRILFNHNSDQDDHSINMAFSKAAIAQRKEWLGNWMEESKRRKELGLPEIYLYEKNTRSVTYSDFINKELVLFSNCDNERSIPSIVDGFKPGQRKVMFTCLKRNDKREVKVAQLAGSVGEMSAYHHGEMSLMGTIIGLAQNYVGSNNINLLQPIGQFGTRLAGGKDHASPRYIFTQMSPLARLIFNPNDDPILNHLTDDNQKIEPEWYIPIIPMVLVNGADGIGTGWSTKIPNYDPREIVKNLRRMLNGQEPEDMSPWFKGFTGTIEGIGEQRYVINGELASISDTKVEITELPIRTWTQTYKEQVMEPFLNGSEKTPAMIQDFKEYHTDKTVKFVVQMQQEKLRKAEVEKGLHQFFKLQTTLSTSSMVLFDDKGALKKYENVMDILREFYDLRLQYYQKRKNYLEGMLEAEALKLSNQARFILEKCDGSLVVENKKKKVMVEELQRRGFDSDPVKKWKKGQDQDEVDAEDDSEDEDALDTGLDYDYLLGMPMWSLTKERKDDLIKKKEDKHHELKVLRDMTKEDLWRKDLTEFLEKLEEVERQEREDDAVALNKAKGGSAGKGKGKLKAEVAPSPQGVRVAPRIADELRTKVAKAAQAKTKKDKKAASSAVKEEEIEKDEFDMMVDNKDANRSLSEKLGFDDFKKKSKKKKGALDSSDDEDDVKPPPAKAKKAAAAKAAGGSGGSKKSKAASGWNDDSGSDSEEDGVMSDLSGFGSDEAGVRGSVEKVDRGVGRRAAANKAKFTFSSDDDDDVGGAKAGGSSRNSNVDTYDIKDSDSGDDAFDKMVGGDTSRTSANGSAAKRERDSSPILDSDDELPPTPPPAKKPAAAAKKKPAAKADSDSDSEFDIKEEDDDDDFVVAKPKQQAAAKKPAKKLKNVADLDDDDVKPKAKPKPKPKKTAAPSKAPSKAKKSKASEDWIVSDDDDESSPPAKKKAKKGGKKKNSWDSDEDDSIVIPSSDDDFAPVEKRAPAGRRGAASKQVKYSQSSDSEDGF